jgi:hypothetical protein
MTMGEHKGSYGTSGGVELTDELVERLAAEAEKGYKLSQLIPIDMLAEYDRAGG